MDCDTNSTVVNGDTNVLDAARIGIDFPNSVLVFDVVIIKQS